MSNLDSLFNLLNQNDLTNQLAKSVQAKPDQVQKLVQMGIPALTQALSKNASTPQGAQALAKALDNHAEDPFDNLSGFLNPAKSEDGAKIIGHILGNDTQKIQNQLGIATGLDASQVGSLLVQLAPMLMGFLGQNKKRQSVQADGLGGLLGSLLGGSGSGMAGSLAGMLDQDKDGDVLDDVGNLLGGFLKK